MEEIRVTRGGVHDEEQRVENRSSLDEHHKRKYGPKFMQDVD